MTIDRQFLSAVIMMSVLSPAMAQHQPYAGMETRQIKALSAEQLADLRAGRGMGLALAAELNGYPGPSHVLELSKELGLSQAQHERVQNLLAAMKAETIPIGERLIALEGDLDLKFASRTITPVSLTASADEIGAVQGALRAAHLKYHLLTLEVLTPQQATTYAKLRGYSPVQQHRHHPAQ
jgi:hypothetical protein